MHLKVVICFKINCGYNEMKIGYYDLQVVTKIFKMIVINNLKNN